MSLQPTWPLYSWPPSRPPTQSRVASHRPGDRFGRSYLIAEADMVVTRWKDVSMDRILAIDFRPRALMLLRSLGCTFVQAVEVGLVPLLTGGVALSMAVCRDVALDFDQRITLNGRHILVLYKGSIPTCTVIPNPPQHDCLWPGLERHIFSIDYLTPYGVQPLASFQLLLHRPPRRRGKCTHDASGIYLSTMRWACLTVCAIAL